MSSFEDQVQKACEACEIPGVVLLAGDVSGKLRYAKAFGKKNPEEPMDLNATFIFASITKLMTSIAALQCVERGLISLDDDLTTIVSELKDLKILTGFEEDGAARLTSVATKITLRHLLTHTSGIAYDSTTPALAKYRLLQGQPVGVRGLTRAERLDLPLLFEPGSDWVYGMSLDYAGIVVSRLSGIDLEEYMQKNIWDAVGADKITFHQELKPKVRDGLVRMTQRGGVEDPAMKHLENDTGKPVEWFNGLLYDDEVPVGDEMGGHGSVGNPASYFKILESLLMDDGKLLKPETVKEMFTPQLDGAAKESFQRFHELDIWKGKFSSHRVGTGVNFGLAGLLTESDEETGMKKGTLSWSGLPNLLWSIDRDSGLALLYASNLLPFGDQVSYRYQQLFEQEMYERLAKFTSKI